MPSSGTEHYVLSHGEILNKMGKKGKTSKPATKKAGLNRTRAGRATTKLIKSLRKTKKK